MTDSPRNDLILRALRRQPTERTPVWMMRQAGRYLPEYMEIRRQAGSFMALCTNPELACEVTMQPLRRFPLDAAILFSDILTVPDAMGLGLYFETGEGPRFERPVRSSADVDRLPEVDPEDTLGYVTEAVRRIRRELDGAVPLIGFSGSPWTVATYMVEGGSSRTFGIIKRMLYDDPDAMHRLLEKVSRVTCDYLNAQIAAGAQAIMIFDTWGSVLTPPPTGISHCGTWPVSSMIWIRGRATRESPPSCSPRGPAAGWPTCAPRAATRLGLTGRRTWPRPGV